MAFLLVLTVVEAFLSEVSDRGAAFSEEFWLILQFASPQRIFDREALRGAHVCIYFPHNQVCDVAESSICGASLGSRSIEVNVVRSLCHRFAFLLSYGASF